MDKKEFLRDNIIGAILWSFSLIYAGHYLDKLFREEFNIDLKSKLEYIIITIVLITNLPVVIKFFFGKKPAEIIVDEITEVVNDDETEDKK